MKKAYEFLKACGAFFVLTVNGDYPAGRPFGAVMEADGELYSATNDLNQVHRQMREHDKIQIVAKKPDSREWIRITGTVEESEDQKLRDRMLEAYPVLQRRFSTVGYNHFLLFRVKAERVEFC